MPLYQPSFRPLPIERYDAGFIQAIVMALLFGLVMVYSASIALPDAPKYAAYSSWHFALRQGVAIAVGLLAGAAVLCIPMGRWHKASSHLMFAALVLLAVVLVPGIGKGVNGARRWLPLPGVSLQPSEVMKLAMILYVSAYAVRRQAVLFSLRRGFGPIMLAIALVGALLLLEPDLGAFVVIVAIVMGILFIGGINAIWFMLLGFLLIAVLALVMILSPWRRARFFAYLDPWDAEHALDKAYQLSHSLIAFGRGEWFGVGLGASVEKLHYLPEAHTDFVLAVIGEELGFAGVAVVIGLFYFIVKRCFMIGRQAIALEDQFAGLVAQGVGIWIGVQACINMAVALGLLPTKGLTLPLMSYGGSGIVMNCIALAIVLRIDRENYIKLGFGRSAVR